MGRTGTERMELSTWFGLVAVLAGNFAALAVISPDTPTRLVAREQPAAPVVSEESLPSLSVVTLSDGRQFVADTSTESGRDAVSAAREQGATVNGAAAVVAAVSAPTAPGASRDVLAPARETVLQAIAALPTLPDRPGTTSTTKPDGSGLTAPTVTIPVVTLPTIPLPTLTVPTVTLPPVTVPPLTVPTVTVPPLTVPTVTVPPTTLPPVTLPPVTLPPPTVPTVTVPSLGL